jgi:2-keto-3-deoxy-L-rhamnonate aldolase RhmA
VKYAPEGHRGIFSGGRLARYGFSDTTGDYAKEANRQTLVCLMLEEVEAIENPPELVTVPGVNVYSSAPATYRSRWATAASRPIRRCSR